MNKQIDTLKTKWIPVPWLVSEALLILCAGLILSTLPLFWSSTGQNTLGIELQAYTFQLAGFILLPILLVHKKYRLGPDALGLIRPSWRMLFYGGILGGLGLYGLNLLLTTLSVLVLPEKFVQAQSVVSLLDMAGTPYEFALVGVFVVVFAPFGEELLFRAFLYPALRSRFGRLSGILIGSGIFAGLHLNLVAFLPLFIGGIGFNLLYDRYQNLFCNATAHAIWNGLALFLYCVTS